MNVRSIRFRLTVWYTGLLAILLLLFGTSVYLGLRHYLSQSLNESLSRQARQIGEGFLIDIAAGGEGYVISEINEHYAPELNNRFVRVTRTDGSVLYVSGKPKESGFDPSAVPVLNPSVDHAYLREVHQHTEQQRNDRAKHCPLLRQDQAYGKDETRQGQHAFSEGGIA